MKRGLKIIGWTVGALAALAAILAIGVSAALKSRTAELPENPKEGKWYAVSPEGALCADGSSWHGLFKKGKENKVVIMLFGGGLAIDDYTAARGSSTGEGSFYFDSYGRMDFLCKTAVKLGIASPKEGNPFRDWTFIVLPYATGDFHTGTADVVYTGKDGASHTLHHHGYTNYDAMMKRVLPHVGTPEALVITGSSAGGWGTALLSADAVSRFPVTENVTVFVDASLGIYDKWKDVAENRWKMPSAISERLVSDEMVTDCLVALHRERPDAKILFDTAVRDEALVRNQTYLLKGPGKDNLRADADTFQQILKKKMCYLKEQVPSAGIFIYDDIVVDQENMLMQHTVNEAPHFLTDRAGNGSIASWLMDAVNGNVRCVGLELLDKKY